MSKLKIKEKTSCNFEELFHNAPIGYIIVNDQYEIELVNKTMCEMLGVSEGQLVGAPFHQFIHSDSKDEFYMNCNNLFSSEKGKTCNLRLKSSRGDEIHAIIAADLRKDTERKLARLSISDITELKKTEEKLLEVESLFKGFIDQSYEPIVIINDQCNIYEWNLAQENLTGYTRDEVLGERVWDVQWKMIPHKMRDQIDIDDIKKMFETYFQTGNTSWIGANIKARIERKNGEFRDIQQTTFAINTRQGNMLGSITRDVSKQLEAERQIKSNEELLRVTTESLNDIVWRIDSNSTFSYVSPSVTRILGYSKDEIMESQVLDLIHSDDITKAKSNLEALLSKQLVLSIDEYQIIHKSGALVPMEISVNSIEDGEGNVIGISGVSRDISDRKKMEETVRQSNQRFKTVFNQAAIGFGILDAEGHFFEVNRQFEEITGYTKKELKSITCYDISHPDDIDREMKQINKVLAGEIDSYIIEKRYIHKNGSIVWIILHSTVARTSEGEIQYAIAAVNDITAKKAAELALKVKEDQVRFLASSAIDLVKFENEQDIWQYTADKTYEIIKQQGVVIVSSYTDDEKLWQIKVMKGLGAFATKINDLLGVSLSTIKGNRELSSNQQIEKNVLSEVSSDPKYYTAFNLPEKGLKLAFKLLKIEKIYEIVFTRQGQTLGLINIVQMKGDEPLNKSLIEAFISQVSVFLRRKLAVNELEKYKGHLEELVKDRTRELEEKNEELERFNQLFVGREFRIKELKEKLELLEKEIKRFKGDENHAG